MLAVFQSWCAARQILLMVARACPLSGKGTKGDFMMDQATEDTLNILSEAERAGGRVLHELVSLVQSAELRELLKKVGHDEGYYAGELYAHVLIEPALRRLKWPPTRQILIRKNPVGELRGSDRK
jgi:hypothetical protein